MRRLLSSINRDDTVELIVVAPSARRSALASELRLSATTLRWLVVGTPHTSLSAMRNCGARLASGEILGFPDDDCWYEGTTFSAISSAWALLPTSAERRRVLVARWHERSSSSGGAIGNEAAFLTADPQPTAISLLVPRAVFAEVGPFRPDLGLGTRSGGGEETEWCLRALAADVPLISVDDAVVRHDVSFAGGGVAIRRRARGYAAGVTIGAGCAAGFAVLRRHSSGWHSAGVSARQWGAHLVGSAEGWLWGLAAGSRWRLPGSRARRDEVCVVDDDVIDAMEL